MLVATTVVLVALSVAPPGSAMAVAQPGSSGGPGGDPGGVPTPADLLGTCNGLALIPHRVNIGGSTANDVGQADDYFMQDHGFFAFLTNDGHGGGFWYAMQGSTRDGRCNPTGDVMGLVRLDVCSLFGGGPRMSLAMGGLIEVIEDMLRCPQ